jgi:hypothetical protein
METKNITQKLVRVFRIRSIKYLFSSHLKEKYHPEACLDPENIVLCL